MKVNICGDFAAIGDGLDAVKNGSALSPQVVDLFRSSDLNIVNLESPVATDKHAAIRKVGPNISTSAKAVEYLKYCHVNLVTLANNHFYDYGMHGVSETIKTLKENEIDYIGGGLDPKDISKIYYYEKDGCRIAILNYCETEFSITGTSTNTGRGGSNQLNPIGVYKDLQTAKKNSDYRIVICHGGHEGFQLPSPRMKEWYRFFVESGADIVCNHHQHCFSGSENYKDGMIFYGLGNFFFDDFRPLRNRSSLWNYGYVVALDITNHAGIKPQVIPYKQCLDIKTVSFLSDLETDHFEKDIAGLSAVISDEDKFLLEYNKWCQSMSRDVMTNFSPYSNHILKALCRRRLLPTFLISAKCLKLYNIIRCESHREVAMEVLREKSNVNK